MAQLTIQIQNTQLPRVIAGFTTYANQGNPSPAVVVDQTWVETYLKQHIREIVRESERYTAIKAAQDAVIFPPDIT